MENSKLIDELVKIEGALGELQGLELLNYHNKNHLAYDNKQLSEEKQRLINRSQRIVLEIRSMIGYKEVNI